MLSPDHEQLMRDFLTASEAVVAKQNEFIRASAQGRPGPELDALTSEVAALMEACRTCAALLRGTSS